MSRTFRLQLPLSEDAVRQLAVGDLIYLDGEIVVTAGLPTHQRILDHIAADRPLPFDLAGAAMFHLGSYSGEREGRLDVVYMNPTTSTRFNPLMPTIIKALRLRAVGGKGGLSQDSARAMQEVGCVYLSFLGGGAALHTGAIEEVVAVAWNDLVPHYRLVKLRVSRLGPLTVGIDAHGNSIYDDLSRAAAGKRAEILQELDRARRLS